MRLQNWLFTACFAIATAFSICTRKQSQAISGDLTGTVTDTSGAVVPNATVTATNSETDVKSSVHANSAGLCRISNVLPGNYTVSADSPGFTHFEFRDVPIQLNQAATVNITMSLGAIIPLAAASVPGLLPSAETLAALPLTLGQLRAIGNQDPLYLNAGFSAPITSFEPQGYSDYNALTVNFKKRLSKGLQYLAAYTWSHLIDNSTAEVASTFLTPRRAEDFFNLANEKASSALDRRQRFTLSLLYEIPWFKSSGNWVKQEIVGNWEFASIYTYESPELFTPQSGVDSNLKGDAALDRTVINPAGAAGTATTVVGLSSTGAVLTNGSPDIVASVAKNPNARNIQAGLGAYGNAGRNTEPSRPIDNIDCSLVKHLPIHERFKVDLAGQAFNLFNHQQFLPGGSINNANTVNNFLGSTQAYVTVSNPLFNNPTNTFSSNPRVVQIRAKLFW